MMCTERGWERGEEAKAVFDADWFSGSAVLRERLVQIPHPRDSCWDRPGVCTLLARASLSTSSACHLPN